MPEPPQLPQKIKIQFGDKNRDNFLNLAEEAMKRRLWEVPLKSAAN